MAKPTRVALLDGGEMYTKEYLMYWNFPSEARATLPSYSVLIDHQDGLFLFDTGFDLQVYKESFGAHMASASQTPEQTLPAQLQLLGLRPDAPSRRAGWVGDRLARRALTAAARRRI